MFSLCQFTVNISCCLLSVWIRIRILIYGFFTNRYRIVVKHILEKLSFRRWFRLRLRWVWQGGGLWRSRGGGRAYRFARPRPGAPLSSPQAESSFFRVRHGLRQLWWHSHSPARHQVCVPVASVADLYHFDTDPDPGCGKTSYGSGSRTNFDTDPDPGK